MIVDGKKWCPDCGKMLDVKLFYVNIARSDKLDAYCKFHIGERHKASRDRHKDRVSTWHRQNYLNNKDVYAANSKKWHEENREYHNAINLQKYYDDKEAWHIRGRKWMERNPGRLSVYHSNRRALIYRADGKFTRKQWEDLKEFYSYRCLKCGREEPEIKLTADHIIPLNLGGTNTIDNIQPLCRSCNTSKARRVHDYRGEITWM